MATNTLRRSRIATRKITVIGLLSAVTIVMGLLNIGFIPLPMAKATIMHLPVIIGAIVEGPVVGAAIGLMFGLFSMYQAVTNPIPTSFVFLDPLVAVLPRVMIGIVSYYSFVAVKKALSSFKFGTVASLITSAALATITNTAGVLTMIYLRHGAQFVEAIGKDASIVGRVLLTIAMINGIPEVIVACVMTTLVVKSLRIVKS